MPAIIAVAVIRMARNRPWAPSIAASRTDAPSRRAFSANVTRRIAFATEMPIAIIAPMNDCTERLLMDVGREAHDALHVVPIDFARGRSVVDRRDICHEWPARTSGRGA